MAHITKLLQVFALGVAGLVLSSCSSTNIPNRPTDLSSGDTVRCYMVQYQTDTTVHQEVTLDILPYKKKELYRAINKIRKDNEDILRWYKGMNITNLPLAIDEKGVEAYHFAVKKNGVPFYHDFTVRNRTGIGGRYNTVDFREFFTKGSWARVEQAFPR